MHLYKEESSSDSAWAIVGLTIAVGIVFLSLDESLKVGPASGDDSLSTSL